MNKKTFPELLVKTLVLAGVIRIFSVAGNSLIGTIDIISDSKDITWVPVPQIDVGVLAAGAESHLGQVFHFKDARLNESQSYPEYLSLSQEQRFWKAIIRDTKETGAP